MNPEFPTAFARYRPPHGMPDLRAWNHADPAAPFAGHGGDDYAATMREVDMLMDKGFPLGMAVIVGEIDASLCRRLKEIVARQADYIAWVATGPILMAVFRKNLFAELRIAWYRFAAENAGVTAGVAFSEALTDHRELLLAARLALYRAMTRRLDLLVFDAAEARRAIADHDIAARMKKHLANGGGDFTAHFQPQVDMRSGAPTGAEVLARWYPDEQEIPPARFIPIAEEAGFIGEIGDMMLALSARTLKALRLSGIDIPHVAVNVSPGQSRQGDFLRTALDTLRANRLEPGDIELEITESLAGDADGEFFRWLADISAAGFHLAIDDFGTGTSTIARLRNIPARKIKLDRAFVQPLPHDEGARTVCRTALDMVHGLGKESLAEGVEFAGQASYLQTLGCRLGQGFLWGRPMPERDLAVWWNATGPLPHAERGTHETERIPA